MPRGVHPEGHGKHISETRKRLFAEGKLESCRFIGERNPMSNPEFRKRQKEAISQPEVRKKMSESRSIIYKNNPTKHPMYGKKQKLESIKKMSEWHKENPMIVEKNGMFGKILDKNPAWLGGISFEPYTPDFNKRFKKAIRDRDGNRCKVCNKPEEELRRRLCIHHIDYNKLNTFPQNCISLCDSCHGKTYINRNQWKTFFHSLLKELYGYEYTEEQKIILDFNKNKEALI